MNVFYQQETTTGEAFEHWLSALIISASSSDRMRKEIRSQDTTDTKWDEMKWFSSRVSYERVFYERENSPSLFDSWHPRSLIYLSWYCRRLRLWLPVSLEHTGISVENDDDDESEGEIERKLIASLYRKIGSDNSQLFSLCEDFSHLISLFSFLSNEWQ